MTSSGAEGVGEETANSERGRSRDRLIDGLGLLAAAGFLAWLALAWVQDTFPTWTDALLFVLFFLAMAGACLYRCLGLLRGVFRGREG